MWLSRSGKVAFLVIYSNIFITGDCTHFLTSAISSLIDRAILKGQPTNIDLVYFDQTLVLADKVLRSLPETASVKIQNGGENKPWTNQLNFSTLLLFDSPKEFNETAKEIKWLSNRWMRYRHVVYAPNLTKNDVMEKIRDGFQIDEVAFLMNETKSSIDLVTSFMFTNQKCNESQLFTINRFDFRAREWKNSNFFPRKYGNLHGCSLNVVEATNAHNIHPHLASQFNFQLRHIYDLMDKRGSPVISGTNYPVDYLMNENLLFFEGFDEFMVSTPYATSIANFFAPGGDPITQLEKMFIMFTSEVWVMIIFTLGFFAATIAIVNRAPIKTQILVFGPGIKTPFWNLLDIFLNGGQRKVPTRNFARFVLILVIIWSLIIRTCYQSLLYQFLQSDLREKQIKSVYEINPADDWSTELGHTDENGPTFELKIGIEEELLEASEPENRVIAVCLLDRAEEALTYRSGQSSLHKLDEVYVTAHYLIPFQNFSPFFEEFNSKVGRMFDSGLFFYIAPSLHKEPLLYYSRSNIKRIIAGDDPQVLTMDHLEVAFIACLIPMLMAIAAFLIEMSIKAYQKLIPAISFSFILSSYFELKTYE